MTAKKDKNNMPEDNKVNEQSKDKSLEPYRQEAGEYLTTNYGVRINDTNNSLKVGERGPTLVEDFHFREKMAHL